MSSNQVFCPQCGEASQADTATCKNGHALPNIVRPIAHTQNTPPEPVRKKGFNWIAFVLFVVGLLAFELPPVMFILWGLAIFAYVKKWGK
jgi:hypothetical protein